MLSRLREGAPLFDDQGQGNERLQFSLSYLEGSPPSLASFLSRDSKLSLDEMRMLCFNGA